MLCHTGGCHTSSDLPQALLTIHDPPSEVQGAIQTQMPHISGCTFFILPWAAVSSFQAFLRALMPVFISSPASEFSE